MLKIPAGVLLRKGTIMLAHKTELQIGFNGLYPKRSRACESIIGSGSLVSP